MLSILQLSAGRPNIFWVEAPSEHRKMMDHDFGGQKCRKQPVCGSRPVDQGGDSNPALRKEDGAYGSSRLQELIEGLG